MSVTSSAGGPYWCVEELAFYVAGARIAMPPGGASAQTEHSADFRAPRAYETTRDPATYYCSADGVRTGWLQYDFGAPMALDRYTVKRVIGNGNQFSPTGWTFDCSNDGSRWTTLDTQSGHNTWTDGEVREFGLPPGGPLTGSPIVTGAPVPITAHPTGAPVVLCDNGCVQQVRDYPRTLR